MGTSCGSMVHARFTAAVSSIRHTRKFWHTSYLSGSRRFWDNWEDEQQEWRFLHGPASASEKSFIWYVPSAYCCGNKAMYFSPRY